MKVFIYLDSDGAERVVKGQIPFPYDFKLRVEGCSIYDTPPTDGILVGECEVSVPSRDRCASMAESALRKKLAEVRANAYQEERDLQRRIEELLALPAPTSQEGSL